VIKSYRRALHSGLLRLEDAATQAAQARRWDLSLVDVLMQDVEGSMADLLKGAGRMVQELAGESRRNWETRARNQAMRVMHVASEAYEALGSRQWTMQDCREYEAELESKLKAYHKIAEEVKLSELSTKMRQDAKLRQQGIDTEVYRARRHVARIILAHECNLTQPSRTAPRRNSRSETRSTRGVESAESAGTSGSMDFTVPLDRQSSRRPNQTYVVGGMEGWSQDDLEPPGRNQENDDLSVAGLREGGTRSLGLTVRISEQQERDMPIQPEGASTPLDEVRPTMLDNLAASSIRPDYRRISSSAEAGGTPAGVPELSLALSREQNTHPESSRAPIGTRSSHRDPRRSGTAVPSLPSRSARNDGGILPSRARTKTVDGTRSSPGGARRVRISAGRSPHRDGTDAGARAREAVEEATTATAMTI
jgi:hypothetical protein